jgi:hypothetical protein
MFLSVYVASIDMLWIIEFYDTIYDCVEELLQIIKEYLTTNYVAIVNFVESY